MSTYRIYANGTYWGDFEAESAEEAKQAAANEHGTVDVGQTEASTDGLTAVEAEYSIICTLRDGRDELILTDEGFRPYEYEAAKFDTEQAAHEALDGIDRAYLRADGFENYTVARLWIEFVGPDGDVNRIEYGAIEETS